MVIEWYNGNAQNAGHSCYHFLLIISFLFFSFLFLFQLYDQDLYTKTQCTYYTFLLYTKITIKAWIATHLLAWAHGWHLAEKWSPLVVALALALLRAIKEKWGSREEKRRGIRGGEKDIVGINKVNSVNFPRNHGVHHVLHWISHWAYYRSVSSL